MIRFSLLPNLLSPYVSTSLFFIQKRLQNQRGRHLVNDLPVLLPFMAGLVEDLVCLASGQALVPKVNGQARELAQLSGKGLGLGCAWARFAGEMDRVADHDPRNRKPPAESRERTQVLSLVGSPAAAPHEREHWLCCESQLVRHGHADAAAADVKAQIARQIARRNA